MEAHHVLHKIMVEFNFEKVHQHMVAVEHTWYLGGADRVPTRAELHQTAQELLYRVVDSPSFSISTGGFIATHIDSVLRLRFSDIEEVKYVVSGVTSIEEILDEFSVALNHLKQFVDQKESDETP